MASSDGPLSAATELLLSPVVTPALRARAGGSGIAVDDSLRAARQCAAAASSVAGELAAPNSSGYCSKPSASARFHPHLRLLEALPNFAAPSKLSKNCSRYTVAGSAAGGGTCRYPDVVRQVLL